MKIAGQIKFAIIRRHASSLHALIADGQYRSTSLGRNTWKSLIGPEASLHAGCSREGFNNQCGSSSARIGYVSNNEASCLSCDSVIGFGSTSFNSNSCGNEAMYGGVDNGEGHIKATCYVLVQ